MVGFESMNPHVKNLWICELDQDHINNENTNEWIRSQLDKIYVEFGFEILKKSLVLFISSSEMSKPISLDFETINLLSQFGAAVEFYSD